jgi:preprotein translocase subunit SecA
LKEGVSLRTYGQKDPLVEFKQEAFTIFAELMNNINGEVLGNLFRSTQQLAAFEQFLAQLALQQAVVEPDSQRRPAGEESPKPHDPATEGPRLIVPRVVPQARPRQTAGRNDPCPCGSGKKFKQCCGRTA